MVSSETKGGQAMRSRADVAHYFRTEVGIESEALDWGDIDALLSKGHEVGNHTTRHIDLAPLGREQLVDEVGRASDAFERSYGTRPRHFAWPYGRFRHLNSLAPRIVRDFGHLSCASAERGSHVAISSPANLCLRRDHIDLDWPLRHTMWLISRSASRPVLGNWPTELTEAPFDRA